MTSVALKPCGIHKFMYLPHSVMKMVSFCDSWSSGIAWYPSTASVTVLFVCGRIWDANWNGDLQWCVSLPVWELSFWRLIVQHGVLSFFRVTNIELHHSTGVLLSTGLMIPHPMSWSSRLSLTVLFQWCGTGIGECLEYGMAWGCRCRCAGG